MDMERAEQAVQQLHMVQEEERDVLVDVFGAQIPGVLLNSEQSTTIWAEQFMSQVVPPDFMELCQIAASQRNRRNLFETPLLHA